MKHKQKWRNFKSFITRRKLKVYLRTIPFDKDHDFAGSDFTLTVPCSNFMKQLILELFAVSSMPGGRDVVQRFILKKAV